MPTPQLRADCTKCCALCCVGPAFYAEQGFGFSKPAQAACPNLRRDFRCAIHEALRPRGFPACASFDCYGAGQRVTQQLFGGRSWQSSPELAPLMFAAYDRYRALHELMALLDLAIREPSTPDAEPLRERLGIINALCESGEAANGTIDIEMIRNEVLRQVRAALSSPTLCRPGT